MFPLHSQMRQFSDISQILKADHHLMVSGLIRSNIDALDDYLESLLPDPEDANVTTHHVTAPNNGFDSSEYEQIRELGSQEKPCSFADLEKAHHNDHAFKNFRIELVKFLKAFLPMYVPLPNGVKLHPNDLV